MKKLFAVVLTLLLALSAVACAEGETFKTDYFSLTLPAGWDYELDDLDDMSEENFQCLALFGVADGKGLTAACYLEYFEEMKDLSLWNADDAALKEYLDILMEDFADEEPEYLGTVNAGSIPFVLIRGVFEGDQYLYAETMTNGYAIEFEVYMLDNAGETYPLSDSDIEQFKNVLTTFQPVT